MRWWVELVIGALALVGLWVTLDRASKGILRAWAWLRRDRVSPLLEDDDRPEGVLCAGCAGFDHCDGVEGGCDCTCGWPEDWADEDDERVAEPSRHDWDSGCRERGCQVHGNWDLAELEPWRAEIAAAVAWWEELPSGTGYTRAMAARVRELTP